MRWRCRRRLAVLLHVGLRRLDCGVVVDVGARVVTCPREIVTREVDNSMFFQ